MSKKKVSWSSTARHDLLDVVAYIHGERPSAARKFVKDLDKRLKLVARFPDSGRPIPEDLNAQPEDTGRREVIIMNWRVGYQVSDVITVLYVIHGAREFPRRGG